MNYQNLPFTWTRKVGFGIGFLTLGISTFLLPACNEPTEIAEDRTNVTTEDFPQTSQVSESIGQEATIRSPIVETLDENGVLMQTQDGADSILVLNVSPMAFNLPTDDTPVQVTGQVMDFKLADIETQYGLALDETIYGEYDQQPVVLADNWALAPTPEMLSEQPDVYVNQRVAVEGDARILSPNALAVYEDGWIDDVGILVVGVQQNLEGDAGAIQEGESVTVTGMAQPLDQNLLKGEYDLGLTAAEVDEFVSRYTERPVILADRVYASAVDE
jgi:hypothetical protein